MEKIKLNVEGMHCGSCEKRIEMALEDLPGIKKVKADQAKNEVMVKFDSSVTPLDEIKAVIEGEEFKVVA